MHASRSALSVLMTKPGVLDADKARNASNLNDLKKDSSYDRTGKSKSTESYIAVYRH